MPTHLWRPYLTLRGGQNHSKAQRLSEGGRKQAPEAVATPILESKNFLLASCDRGWWEEEAETPAGPLQRHLPLTEDPFNMDRQPKVIPPACATSSCTESISHLAWPSSGDSIQGLFLY